MRINSADSSLEALYQKGLMLSASTSMPCASIAARRTEVSSIRRPGASSGCLITAIALGTQQWACTSIVLTRLPLTTTSRRRGCAWPCPPEGPPECALECPPGPAAIISQPTNPMSDIRLSPQLLLISSSLHRLSLQAVAQHGHQVAGTLPGDRFEAGAQHHRRGGAALVESVLDLAVGVAESYPEELRRLQLLLEIRWQRLQDLVVDVVQPLVGFLVGLRKT